MSAREQINFFIQRTAAEYNMNACMKDLIGAGFFPVHDSFEVPTPRKEEFEKIVNKYFPSLDKNP